MTTRADLRTRARSELNDSGAPALWSDSLINQWIVDALRAFCRQVGLEKSVTLTSVAGQTSYALPTDLLQARRVEHPSGLYRTPAPFASGDAAPNGTQVDGLGGPTLPELLYDVWAGELALSPAPASSGEPIVVRYVSAYAEPSSDASVLDVAQRDEDVLVLFICARAMRWIGMDEGKRQRFERQRGADPHALRQEYEREYQALVRQRQGRVATRRLAIRSG